MGWLLAKRSRTVQLVLLVLLGTNRSQTETSGELESGKELAQNYGSRSGSEFEIEIGELELADRLWFSLERDCSFRD